MKKVYLETFGCQMNVSDSERVATTLATNGFEITPLESEADVILINTCSVREQAENKVLSRIGEVGIFKRDRPEVILGVIGCMAERDGIATLGAYALSAASFVILAVVSTALIAAAKTFLRVLFGWF